MTIYENKLSRLGGKVINFKKCCSCLLLWRRYHTPGVEEVGHSKIRCAASVLHQRGGHFWGRKRQTRGGKDFLGTEEIGLDTHPWKL